MGAWHSLSQEEINIRASEFFSELPENYINVGIDESLLRYSGLDSAAKLEDYSSQLLIELGSHVPDYAEKLSSALVDLAVVPNAVGIGALVISMILQVCFVASMGHESSNSSPADLLRRVFAEEKSSEVRDLMEEYLKRYRMHLTDSHLLLLDTKRLEEKLSIQLTRLRNSMLVDGHMSSRALKHWANGAAFHTQMLLHIARLKKNESVGFESAKIAAVGAINTYDRDMSDLLKHYKAHRTSSLDFYTRNPCHPRARGCTMTCIFTDSENDYRLRFTSTRYCGVTAEEYVGYMCSNNTQILELKKYFPDLQENIEALIGQQGAFRVISKF